MDTGIGPTLREARKRRKVELSEVEAAIKIRARYLRAMENEEWGVLPGGAYTRGFLRTYAIFLGLDGERLAEEYSRSAGPAVVEGGTRLEPVTRPRRGTTRWLPGWAWVLAVSAILVAIMVGVGLAGEGDNGSPAPEGPAAPAQNGDRGAGGQSKLVGSPGVAVEIEAKGEVWVCLVDLDGEELIDGQILEVGAVEGPFRADGFMAAFGNGEVEIQIDGREAETPASSSPIGFEIDADGELRELEEGQRPDCE